MNSVVGLDLAGRVDGMRDDPRKPEGIREAKERERREDTTPAAARHRNVTYAVNQSRKGEDASQ